MNDVRTLPQTLPRDFPPQVAPHGLRRVLGAAAWPQLPAAVRWLLRAATPYTYAGWAFAVLVPQRKNDAAIATGRRRNSSGGWSHRSRAARRRRRGGGGG